MNLPNPQTHTHACMSPNEARHDKDIMGDYPAFLFFKKWDGTIKKKTTSPSIMVADLHSSISKEPGVKTRGVGRGRREEAPNYHRDTV